MMTTNHEKDAPRIYVASLSDYNAGRLHGRWIDAAQSAEEIHAEVAEMLAESREEIAEEWAIHDHEGFYGLEIGEWESFEKIAEMAAAIEEHGPAWVAYACNVGLEYAGTFEEAYQGEFRDEEEFAYQLAEELGEVPKEHSWPASYIDWEAATRDLFMGDYFSAPAPGGGVYVFRGDV